MTNKELSLDEMLIIGNKVQDWNKAEEKEELGSPSVDYIGIVDSVRISLGISCAKGYMNDDGEPINERRCFIQIDSTIMQPPLKLGYADNEKINSLYDFARKNYHARQTELKKECFERARQLLE